MYKVDNAVIMAAGTSSRFAPLSYEMPKALISVKGEVLIERQIRQLQESGVFDIYIVTGYQADKFQYLKEKLGVLLIHNPDYLTRNNHSSIYAARSVLKNTYVCSADNYFMENPFEREVKDSYYAAVYADGNTREWCMEYDTDNVITKVTVGGENAWVMLGHTFWSETFSKQFIEILLQEYDLPETTGLLWESIYIQHLDELKMRIRKYPNDVIFEFDTLDELRCFDPSYITNSRSPILKNISRELNCTEGEITSILSYGNETNEAAGFTFYYHGRQYRYAYCDETLKQV